MITLEPDDEDPIPGQWHVRIHSRLPGAMIGRNYQDLADALACVDRNPGARLLRQIKGDRWARLAPDGFYYMPGTADEDEA